MLCSLNAGLLLLPSSSPGPELDHATSCCNIYHHFTLNSFLSPSHPLWVEVSTHSEEILCEICWDLLVSSKSSVSTCSVCRVSGGNICYEQALKNKVGLNRFTSVIGRNPPQKNTKQTKLDMWWNTADGRCNRGGASPRTGKQSVRRSLGIDGEKQLLRSCSFWGDAATCSQASPHISSHNQDGEIIPSILDAAAVDRRHLAPPPSSQLLPVQCGPVWGPLWGPVWGSRRRSVDLREEASTQQRGHVLHFTLYLHWKWSRGSPGCCGAAIPSHHA